MDRGFWLIISSSLRRHHRNEYREQKAILGRAGLLRDTVFLLFFVWPMKAFHQEKIYGMTALVCVDTTVRMGFYRLVSRAAK